MLRPRIGSLALNRYWIVSRCGPDPFCFQRFLLWEWYHLVNASHGDMHGDVIDTSLVFTPYATHHQFSHFFLQTIFFMKPHSSTWHDSNSCHHLSPKMSVGCNPSPYFQLLLTSNAYAILCAPPLKPLQCFFLITNLALPMDCPFQISPKAFLPHWISWFS